MVKYTNYYINKKRSTNTNNVFYNTRQLVKFTKITNTWVYNNNVYISGIVITTPIHRIPRLRIEERPLEIMVDCE